RAAAEEVEALVPGVVTAVVNEGVRRGSASSLTAEENKRDSGAAVHLAPEAAREVIRRGAEEAIGRIGKVKPFRLDPRYTVESVLCPEIAGRTGEKSRRQGGRCSRAASHAATARLKPLS